ncbi:helix-turn-helix domain-containing protein [Parabacteroides goldsteinii]|uniref:helix-turn-helix domain-containing protein n=1 Tax=Parabacteroides goldsteinii TaxID=328812 RepID=UPI00331421BD
MNFNEQLKNERKSHNFTQQYVANEIGVSLRAYQQYEQGLYEPNIEKLIKLADLFGITVDLLICHGE